VISPICVPFHTAPSPIAALRREAANRWIAPAVVLMKVKPGKSADRSSLLLLLVGPALTEGGNDSGKKC
jgi:hypothetical protein